MANKTEEEYYGGYLILKLRLILLNLSTGKTRY